VQFKKGHQGERQRTPEKNKDADFVVLTLTHARTQRQNEGHVKKVQGGRERIK